MAKSIEFKSGTFSFSAEIEKVDREKVYGWTETKVYDSKGKLCQVANLLEDGRTILPAGSFALKVMTESGQEVSRASLKAVDEEGKEMALHPSVFEQAVQLEASTIEEYLSMNVKTVYQLHVSETSEHLQQELKSGKLYRFKYNYRAGYESDDAFLVANDQAIFMVTGKCVRFEMLGLQLQAPDLSLDEQEEDDLLDFSLL
ncbi:MAG: hypothetical protein MUF42_08675 [Cytophagaceae bacterium]|jgi:hypothetical protein|nr:hypothetical protein [Cytophagaceae bacterium]